MSEEEIIEILKNKFLKYHLEYKDEEMLFGIIGKLQKENEKLKDNSINKDIIRDKIKKAEKNYESCSKGNVVEKAYYRNKIDTLKELLGE